MHTPFARTKRGSEVVGLKITKEGIEPDEGVYKALKEELAERPKSKKQLDRKIGIILYSSGAFEWDSQDLTWWTRAMKPLHDAANAESFRWTKECEESLNALADRIEHLPRAHCDQASKT